MIQLSDTVFRNMDDAEMREFWEKVIKRVDAFNIRAPWWLTSDNQVKKEIKDEK